MTFACQHSHYLWSGQCHGVKVAFDEEGAEMKVVALPPVTADEMMVDKMTVDEMTVDEMTVDKMMVDETQMMVDEMMADEMMMPVVEWTMPGQKMMAVAVVPMRIVMAAYALMAENWMAEKEYNSS